MRYVAGAKASIEQASRTKIGQARLAGIAGVALALIGVLLHLVFLWLFFPFDARETAIIQNLAVAHAISALLASLGVFSSKWPTFSAFVMSVSFLGSFVVGGGWYFLLTPSPLALAGVGGLLYLASGSLMVAAALAGPSRR